MSGRNEPKANQITNMTELTKPIVHSNGTSAEDLLESYIDAMNALRDAQSKLTYTLPNGRDYYCHPDPDALTKARKEHDARQRRITDILGELMTLAEHVNQFTK